MNQRELFFRHLAQTSPEPIGLEIVSAQGTRLHDVAGRSYIDLIGGISVCNLGHRHPKVVEAIKQQVDQYLHVLVYGEFIQSPQVQYASMLAAHLPATLDSVFFTNSGAEATEGAMKLAKRATGRTQIIAFNHSYHGSTQGALSVMGDEYWRNAFRPLLPDILHLDYDQSEGLEQITQRTACVIAETVQAEIGVRPPSCQWIQALEKKCRQTGALLVLDEIQVGFGRTGSLWGFQGFGVTPDILLLGKALGGGMPLGAFIASRKLMQTLTSHPVLGHISTFGGHPVSCAAGMAAFKALLDEDWISQVAHKADLFRRLLCHPRIKSIRSSGLLIAVEFEDFQTNRKIIEACLHAPDLLDDVQTGILTDWFLFAPQCMRIAPPLTISDDEIITACRCMTRIMDQI